MKAFLAVLILACVSVANAQDANVLNCQVTSPCKAKNDIGYCVGTIHVISEGGRPSYMVVNQQSSRSSQEVQIAAVIPVTKHLSTKVMGMSSDGQHNFELRMSGQTITGKVTLNQSFDFALHCNY